jgi:hypothetical protein
MNQADQCPNCGRALELQDMHCTACGYNAPIKPEPTSEEIVRSGELVADREPALPTREELGLVGVGGAATADELCRELESRGLGWSLDNNGRLIEARVWDWPYVVGRYRPNQVEPLAQMLAEAMSQVDWSKYPNTTGGGGAELAGDGNATQRSRAGSATDPSSATRP